MYDGGNNNQQDASNAQSNAQPMQATEVQPQELRTIHATVMQLHNTDKTPYTTTSSTGQPSTYIRYGFVLDQDASSQPTVIASSAILVGFPTHCFYPKDNNNNNNNNDQQPQKLRMQFDIRDGTGYCKVYYLIDAGLSSDQYPKIELNQYYTFVVAPTAPPQNPPPEESKQTDPPKRYMVQSFKKITDFNEITYHNLMAMKTAWACDPDKTKACQLALITIAKALPQTQAHLIQNLKKKYSEAIIDKARNYLKGKGVIQEGSDSGGNRIYEYMVPPQHS